jgi:GT2 family glycosyltransferase
MYDIVVPYISSDTRVDKLLDSIVKYTRLEDLVNLVCVGPESNYSLRQMRVDGGKSIAESINIGVNYGRAEYIVIIHGNSSLLEQNPSQWLDQLRSAVTSVSDVAVAGPLRLTAAGNLQYVDMFCAIVPRRVWNEVGPLLDSLSLSSASVEWALRASKMGLCAVGTNSVSTAKSHYTGTFPIYFSGDDIQAPAEPPQTTFTRDMPSLVHRVQRRVGTNNRVVDVTAHISTLGRFHTTLLTTLQAISFQSVVPGRLLIFNDDRVDKEFYKQSTYENVLNVLSLRGCTTEVHTGQYRGQVANHQSAIDLSTTEFIWRVDDDDSPEPNVLETLVSYMDDDVGAVAPCVYFPWITPRQLDISASGLLSHVKIRGNVQWYQFSGNQRVEHLHNTFIFRKSAAQHGYPKNLSVVGHREETMFSYGMHVAGWKLLVAGDCIAWHLRDPQGGIRTQPDTSLWDHDEAIFNTWAKTHGVAFASYYMVVLDCGLGDHFAFKHVWDRLRQKVESTGSKVILAVSHPNVIDYPSISIAEAKALDGDIEKYNVYNYMFSRNWTGTLIEAFESMYGL